MSDLDDILSAYSDPRLDAKGFRPWPVLPPIPRKEAEARAYRRPGEESIEQVLARYLSPTVGAHDMAAALTEGGLDIAHKGDPTTMATTLGALALPVPGAKRIPRRPQMTLEQYVDQLKQPRDGRPPLLNYDKYLEDPHRTINARSREFETQEPAFTRDVPQRAKNLEHYRLLDSLREKRDAGMMIGSDGTMVNPWYWPGPLYDKFRSELGPDLAHERMSKFLDYNAATSMQTSVPRNIIEGWWALHHDLNDIPFSRLNAAELTGAAHPNKVKFAGDIAEGRGLMGKEAHKIRNYSLNLHGVGTAKPEYRYLPGGEVERILQPATLDSIMAREMKLRGVSGEPKERFVGPIYRHGVGTINKLGEEVGAAAADTQAGIWQSAQLAKHGDPVYRDSFARIFDNVINRVAEREGKDPNEVFVDLAHGRKPPPNIFSGAAIAAPIAGILMDYGDEQ